MSARLAPGQLSAKQRDAKARREAYRRSLWERDAGYCLLCAEPVALEVMELDHIVPAYYGGPAQPGNLRTAHRVCNKRRGRKPAAAIEGRRELARLLAAADAARLAASRDWIGLLCAHCGELIYRVKGGRYCSVACFKDAWRAAREVAAGGSHGS